jgi:hypothetical protein
LHDPGSPGAMSYPCHVVRFGARLGRYPGAT